MAKIKYSALVSDMRNKLNGSVASKNRFGSYLRNKVSPVNAQTTAQMLSRQQLGSLSGAWRGLTEEARQTWLAAVENYQRTDQFGDSYKMTGQNLFISLNKNMMTAGATAVTTIAPTPETMPEFAVVELNINIATGDYEATFNVSTIPTGFKLIIEATPPVSAGKYFVKNLFKVIASTSSMTGGVIDLNSNYNGQYGTPAEGTRVSVRAYLINIATGQASTRTTASTIVVDII